MKKKTTLSSVCLLALLLSFSAFGSTPARAQLGVAGGATFNSLSDVEGGTETAVGYHVGLFYDLSLGPLAIRPGVFYMDVGEIQFEDESRNFDLQMIQIPIDARLRVGATPFVIPYVMAGPVFRINASADDNENVEKEDFSLAANAGIGVELALPGSGLRLYPEILYTFGIGSVAGFPASHDEARLNNFLVRLGIAF